MGGPAFAFFGEAGLNIQSPEIFLGFVIEEYNWPSAMAVTAIGASQGYQTMAKTLNYLTYRTLSEPKTHAIFKTIMIFTHKRKVTGGRQTIVAKSFISNDKEALVEKLKHKASILRDPKHTKSIPNGSEQPIVATDRRRLDVDHCSTTPSPPLDRL